jgi:hypothetical protein
MRFLLALLVLLLLHLPSLATAAVVTVAVIRPEGPDFAAAEQGLTGELPSDCQVVRLIGPLPTAEALEAWLAAHPAQVLVAMDNPHIALVSDVTRGRLPLVALMGLNLKQALAGRAAACGIAYETPIWSLVTGFAARTGTMPSRVLAPHRGSVHGAEIADAVRQLARQGITVVPLDIEAEANGPAAQAAWLARNLLRAAENVDVVVVPADNVLVDARSLPTWLSAARRSNRPFLSPVARFVDEEHGFCAYTAEVDHERLGAQAAELVLQLVGGEITPAKLGVEYLVGVGERLDLKVMRRLGLTALMPENP